MRPYKFIVLLLSVLLLMGCSKYGDDIIDIPVLQLKAEVEPQISEKFKIDYMTYVVSVFKLYNSYLEDPEDNIGKTSTESVVVKAVYDKWSKEDLSGIEKEMFKKISKANDDMELFDDLYIYKQKSEYDEHLPGIIDINKTTLNGLLEYFEKQ